MKREDLGTRAADSSTEPEPWPWWGWILTFLSYVFLGYHLRSIVLNWIVGPLYPLLVMYILPRALRTLFGSNPSAPLLDPELPT